jgi:hypothetical protein
VEELAISTGHATCRSSLSLERGAAISFSHALRRWLGPKGPERLGTIVSVSSFPTVEAQMLLWCEADFVLHLVGAFDPIAEIDIG